MGQGGSCWGWKVVGRDVGRWIPAAPVGWPWTSEPAAGASTAWGGVLGAAPRGSSPSPGAGGGFFRQAPALMLCLQDGDIETAQGLSAEKAALSTVGFYTNKKKIISTIAEWGVCQPWGGGASAAPRLPPGWRLPPVSSSPHPCLSPLLLAAAGPRCSPGLGSGCTRASEASSSRGAGWGLARKPRGCCLHFCSAPALPSPSSCFSKALHK